MAIGFSTKTTSLEEALLKVCHNPDKYMLSYSEKKGWEATDSFFQKLSKTTYPVTGSMQVSIRINVSKDAKEQLSKADASMLSRIETIVDHALARKDYEDSGFLEQLEGPGIELLTSLELVSTHVEPSDETIKKFLEFESMHSESSDFCDKAYNQRCEALIEKFKPFKKIYLDKIEQRKATEEARILEQRLSEIRSNAEIYLTVNIQLLQDAERITSRLFEKKASMDRSLTLLETQKEEVEQLLNTLDPDTPRPELLQECKAALRALIRHKTAVAEEFKMFTQDVSLLQSNYLEIGISEKIKRLEFHGRQVSETPSSDTRDLLMGQITGRIGAFDATQSRYSDLCDNLAITHESYSRSSRQLDAFIVQSGEKIASCQAKLAEL